MSSDIWPIVLMIAVFVGVIYFITKDDGRKPAPQRSNQSDNDSKFTITITAKGPLFRSFRNLDSVFKGFEGLENQRHQMDTRVEAQGNGPTGTQQEG